MKKIITAIAMILAIGLTGTAFAGGIQHPELNDQNAVVEGTWLSANTGGIQHPEINDQNAFERITLGSESPAKDISELPCFVYNSHSDWELVNKNFGYDVLETGGRC